MPPLRSKRETMAARLCRMRLTSHDYAQVRPRARSRPLPPVCLRLPPPPTPGWTIFRAHMQATAPPNYSKRVLLPLLRGVP